MAQPIALRLSTEEKRRLWNLRLSTQSKRVWLRVTGLLMLAGGESARRVAKHLGVCSDTVTNWKHRWHQGRFFQLGDLPRTGRPARATARYRRALEQAVERGPRSYGYLFTVWSAGRLAAHLKRRTGIDLGRKQVRHWLRKLGFVFRRPKHTLKSRRNPRAVRAAKTRLEALKKGLSTLTPTTSSGTKTRETSIYILI